MNSFRCLSFLSLLIIVQIAYGAEKVEEKPLEEPNLASKSEAKPEGSNEAKPESPTTAADENTTEDDKKYALGSLCNYCSYCKVGICTPSLGCISINPEILTQVHFLRAKSWSPVIRSGPDQVSHAWRSNSSLTLYS